MTSCSLEVSFTACSKFMLSMASWFLASNALTCSAVICATSSRSSDKSRVFWSVQCQFLTSSISTSSLVGSTSTPTVLSPSESKGVPRRNFLRLVFPARSWPRPTQTGTLPFSEASLKAVSALDPWARISCGTKFRVDQNVWNLTLKFTWRVSNYKNCIELKYSGTPLTRSSWTGHKDLAVLTGEVTEWGFVWGRSKWPK